jgi:hypothetical protein
MVMNAAEAVGLIDVRDRTGRYGRRPPAAVALPRVTTLRSGAVGSE